MNAPPVAISLLFFLATPLFAGAGPAQDKGQEIFAERDRLNTGFVDQQVEMDMRLRSPSGGESTRRITLSLIEGTAGEGDKTLLVFQEPADIRGTALLTHETLGPQDDSQWLYLPAYKRVKRIAAGDRSGRFVGTEFSYEDLAGDPVEDYAYTYLGKSDYKGRSMHHIERIPLNPSSEYSKQETWVDPESYQVVHAFLFDKKGQHIKTFDAEDWVEYQGRFWRPHRITMTHLPSGRSTLMTTSQYSLGVGLAEKDFTPTALRRLR